MAKAGQTISLDASASFDPDGDELTFKWWQQDGISHDQSKYALPAYRRVIIKPTE